MPLIQRFTNPVNRLKMLKKKPLFLSINDRPKNSWFTRTINNGNTNFQYVSKLRVKSLVTGNNVHPHNDVVIEQTPATVYLSMTENRFAFYGNAPIWELQCFQNNAQGRVAAQYLSWEDTCIVSADLNPNPPLFFSGPFNGCQFYVTKRLGQRNLRVHHANANLIGQNMEGAHNRPDLAENYLDAIFQRAARPNESLLCSMRKSDYLAKIYDSNVGAKVDSPVTQAYRRRKEGMSRRNIAVSETMCLVFGVFTQNQWNFFYHVAGTADYNRPGLLKKRTNYLKTIKPWAEVPDV